MDNEDVLADDGDDLDLEAVVTDGDGIPLLLVGRDHSTKARAKLVCLELADRTMLMGPRYALAVSEALNRYAIQVLNEASGSANVQSEGRH